MAISTWRSLYQLGGGVSPTLSYGITGTTEDWHVGSVVEMLGTGLLREAADDSSDVWGLSLERIITSTAQGPVAGRCAVHPFTYGTVYAVKETTSLSNIPLATDVGTIRDLDLDGTNGWGIHASASATSNTPTFRVVDIDTTRLEWHVVIAPLELANVFQFLDAAV